jgi:hypothetical protein
VKALATDWLGNTYSVGQASSSFSLTLKSGTSVFLPDQAAPQPFFIKHDADGKALWAIGAQRNSSNTGEHFSPSAITVDRSGRVWVAGTLSGQWSLPGQDSNPIPLQSMSSEAAFIGVMNPRGEFLQALVFNGTGPTRATAIAVDTEGSGYVTGTFSGSLEWNIEGVTYQATSANLASWIAKLTPEGELIWVTPVVATNPGIVETSAIAVSGPRADHDVVVAGSFSGSLPATLGSLTAQGSEDILVLRLERSSGLFIEALSAGGSLLDRARSVALDDLGNAYISGDFKSTPAYFGTTEIALSSAGSQNGFIAKLAPTGGFAWITRLGGNTGIHSVSSVAVGHEDRILVSGHFTDTPSLTSHTPTDNGPAAPGIAVPLPFAAGNTDSFLARLDSGTGVPLWTRKLGGTGSDESLALSIDPAGGVWWGGTMSSSFTVDGKTLSSPGSMDAWIAQAGSASGATPSVDVTGLDVNAQGAATFTLSFSSSTCQYAPLIVPDLDTLPNPPATWTACPAAGNTVSLTVSSGDQGLIWFRPGEEMPHFPVPRILPRIPFEEPSGPAFYLSDSAATGTGTTKLFHLTQTLAPQTLHLHGPAGVMITSIAIVTGSPPTPSETLFCPSVAVPPIACTLSEDVSSLAGIEILTMTATNAEGTSETFSIQVCRAAGCSSVPPSTIDPELAANGMLSLTLSGASPGEVFYRVYFRPQGDGAQVQRYEAGFSIMQSTPPVLTLAEPLCTNGQFEFGVSVCQTGEVNCSDPQWSTTITRSGAPNFCPSGWLNCSILDAVDGSGLPTRWQTGCGATVDSQMPPFPEVVVPSGKSWKLAAESEGSTRSEFLRRLHVEGEVQVTNSATLSIMGPGASPRLTLSKTGGEAQLKVAAPDPAGGPPRLTIAHGAVVIDAEATLLLEGEGSEPSAEFSDTDIHAGEINENNHSGGIRGPGKLFLTSGNPAKTMSIQGNFPERVQIGNASVSLSGRTDIQFSPAARWVSVPGIESMVDRQLEVLGPQSRLDLGNSLLVVPGSTSIHDGASFVMNQAGARLVSLGNKFRTAVSLPGELPVLNIAGSSREFTAGQIDVLTSRFWVSQVSGLPVESPDTFLQLGAGHVTRVHPEVSVMYFENSEAAGRTTSPALATFQVLRGVASPHSLLLMIFGGASAPHAWLEPTTTFVPPTEFTQASYGSGNTDSSNEELCELVEGEFNSASGDCAGPLASEQTSCQGPDTWTGDDFSGYCNVSYPDPSPTPSDTPTPLD